LVKYLICRRGVRAYIAELILKQNNIKNVVNVAGGMKVWMRFSDKIYMPKLV